MKKIKKHKHHLRLGLFVMTASIAAIVLSVLWSARIIGLPAPLIYYSRALESKIGSIPAEASQLNVLFHKQEHSLSCEMAALKMVLDYYGHNVPESKLIEFMPKDVTPRQNGIWGDPDMGFVGDIDGKMGVDGYGIHWKPLSALAENWGETEIIENGLASDLTHHITLGHPIIVWGYMGRGLRIKWKTPDGKSVNVINGEHTRVVYGFKGDPQNPEGFLVLDPMYGPAYWEKDKFMRNWDGFGRSGVVVYP